MRRIGSARAALIVLSIGVLAGCGSNVALSGQSQANGSSTGLGVSDLGQPLDGSSPAPSSTDGPADPASAGTSQVDSSSAPTDEASTTTDDSSTETTPIDANGIPTKGFGWDAQNIYIGFPTANDSAAAFKSAGANFDNGDIPGDARAAADQLNRDGGIFGRKVVPVFFDIQTLNALANPAAVAQQICTYFTQDRPVVAVINGAPQFDAVQNFHTCLEKKGVAELSLTNTLFNDKEYKTLGPHLFTMISLSTDVLVPTFINALNRQGYFSGWNNASGKPGSAPAKIGILLPDDTQGHYVYNVMAASLKRIGRTVTAQFFYPPSGSGTGGQSQVLQFKAAGVTHVLSLPPVEADIGLFQLNSQQQGYHPRHGFTSFNLPASIEENAALAPPQQQIGSLGIGWQPLNDTNAAHDPGATPGQKRCLAAMTSGGQNFDAAHRHAKGVALSICDAFFSIRDLLVAGKGLNGNAMLAGLPVVGSKFLASATFKSAFGVGSQGLPGYYRDEAYNAACSCFIYSGGNKPFSR